MILRWAFNRTENKMFSDKNDIKCNNRGGAFPQNITLEIHRYHAHRPVDLNLIICFLFQHFYHPWFSPFFSILSGFFLKCILQYVPPAFLLLKSAPKIAGKINSKHSKSQAIKKGIKQGPKQGKQTAPRTIWKRKVLLSSPSIEHHIHITPTSKR